MPTFHLYCKACKQVEKGGFPAATDQRLLERIKWHNPDHEKALLVIRLAEKDDLFAVLLERGHIGVAIVNSLVDLDPPEGL